MRTSAADAVTAANKYTSYSVGYCLKWVVTVWQAPSIGCPDAITSWEWATQKHPNDRNPPVGAPVYYRGGNYGHIAICTEIAHPEADTHTAGAVIANIVNTLVGLVAGYLAGRTERGRQGP
jgi:hypothetical protein